MNSIDIYSAECTRPNQMFLKEEEEVKITPISLDDEFTLPECLSVCRVKLTNDFFRYETSTEHDKTAERIDIKDIFNCTIHKEAANDPPTVDLQLVAYPLIKEQRKLRELSFRVNNGASWEANIDNAQKWQHQILLAMYTIPGGFKSTTLYENIRTTSPLFGNNGVKQFMVYVNPRSGIGTSWKMYTNQVKPMLSKAGIHHDVVVTTDRFAAYHSVQSLDLDKYTGIVIVSGDGLLYEIYNGLLHRKDCNEALSFPISIIPGGSGNGLATSLGYVWSEPYVKDPVLVSTLHILNPVCTPLDLVIINTADKKRLISFLSISIGFLADVDIESEVLRSIGDARFYIWSLKNLIRLRTFRCRLSYKIAQTFRCRKRDCSAIADPSTTNTISDCNVNGIAYRRMHSEFADNSPVDVTTGSSSIAHNLTNDTGNGNISPSNSDGSQDSEEEISNDNIVTLPTNESPSALDLDVLEQPVPSDWEVVEDDFIFIFSTIKPFIGKDGYISPPSSLDDGIMYMWVMKKSAPRKALLNFLLSISHGPEPNEHLQRIPVTAFRIEPLAKTGNLVIDGELIDYGPIQATILPGKGSLMAKPL